MAGTEEGLLGGLQEWQLGVVMLVVIALGGVATGLALRAVDIPYGLVIGFVVGAVVTFFAFSYVYYGR